ncbi:MAG: sodium:solute symporter [Leptospiraceae bacterium]|nr:sodium:solute symporter [Leptospiraceae bacterium]NUM40278.1 sodium:solute symporter [Leptospiraceae bacterium]
MSWPWIMLSIVATETSSLTFLSVPGMSFKSNFAFLQIVFGYIAGRAFVGYVILPMYFKGEYSTVYEWVGIRFGKSVQKAMSSIFLITRVLGDGVRLYVTSIPIALLLKAFLPDFSEHSIGIMTLLLITIATSLYTVFGGFKSIVLTDSFQFFVYIAGGVFAFYLISNSLLNSETFTGLFSKGISDSKLKIFHFDYENLFKEPYFFLNAFFGGALISIGSHGVDQMIAQRILACKTKEEGRLALIGSGILVLLQFVLFLSIGFMLFYFYKNTDLIPDKVFSKYILENIPTGILGLIISAILASAMSTLSSTINSLSLSFLVDIKSTSVESGDINVKDSRLASLFWSVLLFFSSLFPFYLSGNYQEGLLELGLKIASFTFGPMIGLFFLGVYFSKRTKVFLHPKGILFALFFGLISTMVFVHIWKPAFTLVIPFGIIFFYIYLIVFFVILRSRNRKLLS